MTIINKYKHQLNCDFLAVFIHLCDRKQLLIKGLHSISDLVRSKLLKYSANVLWSSLTSAKAGFDVLWIQLTQAAYIYLLNCWWNHRRVPKGNTLQLWSSSKQQHGDSLNKKKMVLNNSWPTNICCISKVIQSDL